MALSPDDKLIAVGLGLASPTIQIWDVAKRVEICRLEGHVAYVRDLLFLPDGKTLASSSADQTVRLWDLSDLDNVPEARVLQGHEDEVGCLALLPDGQTVVSGCKDGSVFAWDDSPNTARHASHFSFHTNDWSDWTFSPDKSAIISCSKAGVVSEWTGVRYQRERKLFELGDGYHGGRVADDTTKVAAGYINGEVKIWDVQRQNVIQRFETNDGPIHPDRFYANDQKLAVVHGDWRGATFLWDLNENRKTHSWPHAGNLFSRDASLCLSFLDNAIILSDLRTGTEVKLPESWETSFRWGQVALSPDSRYLAATQESDHNVVVWDLQTRLQVGSYGRFMVGPGSVSFSPDVERVVAGGAGFQAIKLWDFKSQQELLTLEANGDARRFVKFSPEGDILTANDEADVVHCWAAPSWEEIEAAEAKQSIRGSTPE
jgi:WD40 repeat protein